MTTLSTVDRVVTWYGPQVSRRGYWLEWYGLWDDGVWTARSLAGVSRIGPKATKAIAIVNRKSAAEEFLFASASTLGLTQSDDFG